MGGAEYNFKGCYGGSVDTISAVGYFLWYDSKANFSELMSIVSECRSLQLAKFNAYKLHNSLLA